jgi:hypothetical protein
MYEIVAIGIMVVMGTLMCLGVHLQLTSTQEEKGGTYGLRKEQGKEEKVVNR